MNENPILFECATSTAEKGRRNWPEQIDYDPSKQEPKRVEEVVVKDLYYLNGSLAIGTCTGTGRTLMLIASFVVPRNQKVFVSCRCHIFDIENTN